MIKPIEGCNHTQERMVKWCQQGACPVCLTAGLGIANEKLQFTEKERDAAQAACAFVRPLIEEVLRIHADPNSPDYNDCDTDPCGWCVKANTFLSTGCGNGWVSKEDVKPLVEALEGALKSLSCRLGKEDYDNPHRNSPLARWKQTLASAKELGL